eukprot:57811_1
MSRQPYSDNNCNPMRVSGYNTINTTYVNQSQHQHINLTIPMIQQLTIAPPVYPNPHQIYNPNAMYQIQHPSTIPIYIASYTRAPTNNVNLNANINMNSSNMQVNTNNMNMNNMKINMNTFNMNMNMNGIHLNNINNTMLPHQHSSFQNITNAPILSSDNTKNVQFVQSAKIDNKSLEFYQNLMNKYRTFDRIISIDPSVLILSPGQLKHYKKTAQKNNHHKRHVVMRIESDRRELQKFMDKGIDINSKSIAPCYKGTFTSVGKAFLKHHVTTTATLYNMSLTDFRIGQLTSKYADDFKGAMMPHFKIGNIDGRIFAVKWAIRLLSVIYVDVKTSTVGDKHFQSRLFKDDLLMMEHPFFPDMPTCKGLFSITDWAFELLKYWIKEYPNEYDNSLAQRKYQWIEHKICALGSFFYRRDWKWKCNTCHVVSIGIICADDGRWYCYPCLGFEIVDDKLYYLP